MEMKRWLQTTIIAASVVLFAAPAIAQEITLKYAGTLPLPHHITKTQEKFAEIVSEKTENRVEIELYPAGQLYKAHDIPGAVVTGSVDIGDNLANVWTSDAISEINDIPFLYRDAEHAHNAWDREGQLFSLYTQKMNARRMMPLAVFFFGSLFDLASNKPLETPEDFAGLKIRSYGALASEALRALGASPTTIDPGEMYLALQSGTIDAAITGVTTIDQRKLWEATSHATVAGVAYGIFAVNMNLDKFNSLPEDVQAALKDAAWEAAAWSFERAVEEDARSTEFLREHVEVKVLDDEEKQRWSEIVSGAFDSWKSRADEDEIRLVEWIRSL